jgi:hypothetical protein
MIRLNSLAAVLAIGIVGTAAVVAAFAYFDVTGAGVSTSTTSTFGSTCSTGSCQNTRTLTTTTKSTALGTSTTALKSTSTTSTSTTTSIGTTSATSNCCNKSTQRLGFWLQEGDISNCTWQGGYQQCGAAHPAQLFFNSMFLTPPYPSTIEVMIFAILQDHTNKNTPGADGSYTASSLVFWNDLAALCDSNPNIRLIFEVAFIPGDPVYGLSAFQLIVDSLGRHSSVYGLGIEGEYTQPQTTGLYSSAMPNVTTLGKQFINYYARVVLPAGAFSIAHTNFPGGDAGGSDQVSTLRNASPGTVGIDSGYYASFQFPGTVACPIGPTSMNNNTWGFNQCVVSTELNWAVSLSASNRQFVELDPGFSSGGSFIGVSGRNTTQLWDNPTLRNWIWTDPSYQPNFVMST